MPVTVVRELWGEIGEFDVEARAFKGMEPRESGEWNRVRKSQGKIHGVRYFSGVDDSRFILYKLPK
jgi:hypothetical protein